MQELLGTSDSDKSSLSESKSLSLIIGGEDDSYKDDSYTDDQLEVKGWNDQLEVNGVER
jgi:hypothetical protein